MTDSAYIIGIDLGTTNSVVAFIDADVQSLEDARIRLFEIPQVVDAGVLEARPILPSFVLLPAEQETPPGALALPWDASARTSVGEYARRRGEEIPQRLIASSKSWLCNTMVDRNAPILPWDSIRPGHSPKSAKLSPVAASAAILRHIRDAWNHRMARTASGLDERLKMENQTIYLTVPASFDAVARELTVAAADMAGLRQVTLLEEPQAAFYAWISGSAGDWRDEVAPGDLILVCDVGGGTSDFSLIQVAQEEGDLVLERIAVGNHLLVGGNNMDLALAYALARQLAESGPRLDAWQMNGLWHSCRRAKEQILSDPQCERLPVTILGRGSSLIGGMVQAELTRELVQDVLRDGFFPACEPGDKPKAARRAGIQEFGLPFESDPAITRHLAAFLDRRDPSGQPINPTAVLFNGGVMKSKLLREQVVTVLNSWRSGNAVREIKGTDFDLAVARGAAYYGLARLGRGIRIRGGLGRSYYIGVAAAMPAVPGLPAPTKALCVASFGMEEGTSAAISGQEFVLRVGEAVAFDFLGATTRTDDAVGTIVEDWQGEIEAITTLETTLEGDYGQTIPVTLELRITEVGTLELWCVSKIDDRRWKLEWNVREQ
ncbi:MAG: Hsp70 family protein [Desulfobacteraceae bacterium]|nr:MAG: Hsp70 family protein [Desulfobacteraceae bacterium]